MYFSPVIHSPSVSPCFQLITFSLGVGWDWVLSECRPLTGLLYRARMIGECGAVGGMRSGRGNRSTLRKPAQVVLCPPQIPHDLTWARTWAAAVRSQRLTFWVIPWSSPLITLVTYKATSDAYALWRCSHSEQLFEHRAKCNFTHTERQNKDTLSR
jgi:hypothetical protein